MLKHNFLRKFYFSDKTKVLKFKDENYDFYTHSIQKLYVLFDVHPYVYIFILKKGETLL